MNVQQLHSRNNFKVHSVCQRCGLFFNMNHQKVYVQLIENRKANPLPKDMYTEEHHIVPYAEGGSDEKHNLVNLTAREHYIAHLLLAKIYDDVKMYSAVAMMQCKTKNQDRSFKFNSKLYAKLREDFGKKMSIYIKGRFSGEKHWNYGKHLSDEAKEKQRLAHLGQILWNKGIPMSEEAKKKLSINNGSRRQEVREKLSKAAKNRPPISEETRHKMSKAHKGRLHTEESKLKMSINNGSHRPEVRAKLASSKIGRKWFNNGKDQICQYKCPLGFVPGRIKKAGK